MLTGCHQASSRKQELLKNFMKEKKKAFKPRKHRRDRVNQVQKGESDEAE